MYRERPSTIAGAVAWESAVAAARSDILPDGCMDLIWHDGHMFIAGPDTRPHAFEADVGTGMIAVRFPPGMAPTIFGVPACELRNARVALDAVWSTSHVRQLSEDVDAEGARAIERMATTRLRELGRSDPLIGTIAGLAQGNTPVRSIAHHVGLGERQLHRRCLDAFGYGAKTLTRIMRMRQAIDHARAGRPLAETAATAGYADQAHLARDVRALTGRTLTNLLG
ncbi:MAG: helix-turn-helix domain-containing protein [Ilumatobacteraceae bacterium]